MKKILGLDLGTTSIGWAIVNEAENEGEQSSIIKLGVRVNPLTVDEQRNFEQGKSITTNADRRVKRSMRRNLARYKLRRQKLIDALKRCGIITDSTVLNEDGNKTTFQTYRLRSKAATTEISLEDFARVLLMINKKRGYRSSRKTKNDDEGSAIDSMSIAKILYDNNITPGEYVLALLEKGGKNIPDFYRSDLQSEFDTIWDFPKQFFPEVLNDDLKKQIAGKGKMNTSKTFLGRFKIYTADNKGKDKRLQDYKWRVAALTQKLSESEMAYVISDLNGAISNSSGYLGAMSDRSKELYFNKQTVGQYFMNNLAVNPHFSVANRVFYRQDYLDEFETIWEEQAKYHSRLTPQLKKEIRDIIIFYQRPLKSQKDLISFCELESKVVEVEVNGKKQSKTIGRRVCPKSSPLFQEFKIWQRLNDTKVIDRAANEERFLHQEEKELLADELATKESMKAADALKLLFKNYKVFDLNFEKLEGNKTLATILKVIEKILDLNGYSGYDFAKMKLSEAKEIIKPIFNNLGYNIDILAFNPLLEKKELEKQPYYLLWHLLYSFEGDNSRSGNEKLVKAIQKLCGFEEEYAKMMSAITFKPDYGSLSAKAIRNILEDLMQGNQYNIACAKAGYNHSKRSLTKKAIANKEPKKSLESLKRNSLRNPVVEKILNQLVNVVNALIKEYDTPDEIRVELARELKKNAKERERLTNEINKSTAAHEKIREILMTEFNIAHVSRNDIIRYKLYMELKDNGFKTLYSNKYIPKEKLFSKEIDIEHIIPQAKLFDDSFSNKTIEYREVNIKKGNLTACDYVLQEYGDAGLEDYKARLLSLHNAGVISRAKYKKLLTDEANIPEGFIERDLRNSQYIAKKAIEMLEEVTKSVFSTTGSVTDRLREDWQLIDVMQELNWEKYEKLGLTEIIENRDGHKIKRIKDWTKRNDHRHHAMDALVIAFTTKSIIQYLNHLNARSDKSNSISGIEKKTLNRDKHGKLRFNPPMELNRFRTTAKQKLEEALISIKAKNKVVTSNINLSKKKDGVNRKVQLTPRGQLHNETIYGSILQYVVKEEKVGGTFTKEAIEYVAKKEYREALLARLQEFGDDPKKAFTGKNSLEKNPIYLNELHTHQVPLKVKTVRQETVYTIRKEISPDLKIEKVIDPHIREILNIRLREYGNDARKAYSNLEENPIWLNKEQGISIKRVTIQVPGNTQAIHSKRNHHGHELLNDNQNKQPSDFVNTGSNHHVAIYRDKLNVLQENVVSFYEATARAILNIPIVDSDYKQDEEYRFLFTMKQNEYFVFPNAKTGFVPSEIDLMDEDNYAAISPNLYRVQKFSSRDYVFRHHLETNVESNITLKDVTWKRCAPSGLEGAVKVRVNHLGQIVHVGEY